MDLNTLSFKAMTRVTQSPALRLSSLAGAGEEDRVSVYRPNVLSVPLLQGEGSTHRVGFFRSCPCQAGYPTPYPLPFQGRGRQFSDVTQRLCRCVTSPGQYPPLPYGERGAGGRLTGVGFSMDGVPTPSVGTGFCLSVGTCAASGRHADAQKRVPTEKTYP